jgi:predicted NBD/HSP70 family sugar kinase
MCGKQGCVEAYLANYALLREVNLALQHDELSQTIQTTSQLYRMAELGDPTVISILNRAGKVLGRVLANLINIFNPQCIILTGDAMQFSQWQMTQVNEMIDKYAMPNLKEGVKILIEPWDNAMWARGAASLVLRRLFNPPIT